MAFDPNQPFEIVHDEAAAKPAFDPSQPFEDVDPVADRLESMHKASSVPAEQAAHFNNLSQKAGVSYEIAKTIPDKVEAEYKKPDWRAFTQAAPKTAAFLTEKPERFEMAKDDVAQLQELEGLRKAGALIKGGLAPLSGEAIRKDLVDAFGYFKAEFHKAQQDQAVNALKTQFMDDAKAEVERIRSLPINYQQAAWEELGGDGVSPSLLEVSNGSANISGMIDTVATGLARRYNEQIRGGVGEWAGKQPAQDEAQYQQEAGVLRDMSAESGKAVEGMKVQGVEPWTGAWFVQEGLGSVSQVAKSIGTSMVPGLGVPMFYGTAAGSVYHSEESQAMSEADRLERSRVYGAAEYVGESIGTNYVKSAITDAAAPMLKKWFAAAVANGTEEQATQIVSDTYDAIKLGKVPGVENAEGMSDMDKTLAFIDSQLQSFVLGAIGGAGAGASKSAGDAVFDGVSAKLQERDARRSSVNTGIAAIQKELDTISQMKLAKTSPQTLQQMLDAQDGDESQDVYIDPRQLFEDGQVSKEAFLQAAPSAAAQIDEAVQVGGLVRVPRNELLVGIASMGDKGLETGVMRHLKLATDQDSLAELDGKEARLGEEMLALADQQIAKMKDADEVRAKRDELIDVVMQDLEQAGSKEGNKARAALVASSVVTQARDMGMEPMDFYRNVMRFGGVTNEALGGAVLNQGESLDAVSSVWGELGVDGQIYENGDVITVGKIVVPEGQRGQGVGTAAMQRLLAYADANGKHVVLSPSADFGGNVNRLKKFYKGLGFVENKGKNRAFTTRESMYRQAQGKVLFQGDSVIKFGDAEFDLNDMQVEEIDFGTVDPMPESDIVGVTEQKQGDANDQPADTFDNFGDRQTRPEEKDLYLSNFPKERGWKVYDAPRFIKGVRDASDAIRGELGRTGSRESQATRELASGSLGAFSATSVSAEIKGDRLFIYYLGKEQVEAGLTDEPALTVILNKTGELVINGPAADSGTFAEFQKRGWADFAEVDGGGKSEFWTALKGVNDSNKGLLNPSTVSILADAHARLRAWRGEDKVGINWTRFTGSTGNALSGRKAAMFFQSKNAQSFDGKEVAQTRIPEGTTEIDVDGVMRPALNINGQLIHWSVEGMRNFWRWFGDSKVVDAEGKPLVVYHGTNADFSVFNVDGNWDDEVGAFFTTDPEEASSYGSESGANVKPVYLSIANPYVVTDRQWAAGEGLSPREARGAGYDGYVIEQRNGSKHYVAFRPEQIKSAIGNSGAFDANNPGILNQEARGAFSPNTRAIALFQKADLSTFLHEFGHLMLEVQAEMAAMENAPDAVKQRMDTVLQWFGIEGETAQDRLATWKGMNLEQQRPHHEKFAESFERYLFEGKAPSVELRDAFRTFRAWIRQAYNSAKEFFIRTPNAALNDDIRAVFDRLIATEEQIQEAEAARGMVPVYTEKQAWMTQAEWETYQRQQTEAHEAGVDDLLARSLRDLKWARNATNKRIKAMQREARDARREARMDARRQVLSQPIYRAWQFLTAPVEGQNAKNAKARGSAEVDPSRDSLLTAIAKLGGLNKQQAVEQYGIDPADFLRKGGVFGKPVLRVEGGLSPDAMAEALSQYGYMPLDENGKWDILDLDDMLRDEAAGSPHYSDRADYDVLLGNPYASVPNADDVDFMGGRLSRQAIRDMYDDIDLAEMQGLNVSDKLLQPTDKSAGDKRTLESMGVLADDGLHPDAAASLFGLTSGDELVRKLLTMPDPVREIDRLTDQLMMERHADLSSPEAMREAAEAAIHNEARSRFVATELAMLNRAMGKPKLLMAQAKEYAASVVARTKVKDLKPAQYEAAEANAGREALRHMAQGNTNAAGLAKRNQFLHNVTVRAVRDAKLEMDKALAYLKKFDKATPKVDPEYRAQIDTILERYDLRKGQTLQAIQRSMNLAQWIEAQKALGLEPMIPDDVQDEAKRTSYKMLTVEEMRGLVDAVKNIEHLGRLKNRLLTDKKKRDLNAMADRVGKSIAENGGDPKPLKREHNTTMDKFAEGVRGIFAMHRKLASMVRELDGYRDGGAFWELLIAPMNDAGNREAVMREQSTMALVGIFKGIKGKSLTKKLYIPMIADSLSYEGRLSVALNWGNEGNRQRLLDGHKWGQGEVNAILATLDAQDWQFVQAVWDHMESYREAIGEQQKRLTGVEPEWVTPTPFEVKTADGQTITVKGGYYPAKYDTTKSTQSLANEAAGNIMDQWKAAKGRGKTKDGFTKSRATQVIDRPLRMDIGVITQHVTEVTHRLAWQDWVVDANRLLSHPDVDNAIRAFKGPEWILEFRKAVEDIAAGEVPAQNAFERGINHLRVGTTISGLGWNLMTSFLQPLGLTQSMVRIGPKWVASGLARWIGDAARMESTVAEIYKKSDFMRLRGKTQQRELNEVLNVVQGERMSQVKASFFLLIQKGQLIADVPTWLGAYEKAMEHTDGDEARSIQLADQAVLDAQGGGQVKDLARIQRGGPMMKLWTNFYSFFNTTYNLTAESVGRTDFRDPASIGRLAVDWLLLYSLPAAISTLMKDALTDEDDDDDELGKQLIADQVTYLLGTMVGLREVSAAVSGIYGYTGPAGTRFFSETAKLGKQIGQGEADAAFLKSLNNTLGILFHYPAGQINRSVEGFNAWQEGDAGPEAMIFGKPR